jgi:site-specific recombinase XerD
LLHFLREVVRLGSVSAWWREHPAGKWKEERRQSWGILFIYLLDRQLIQMSNEELWQLKPLLTLPVKNLTALWRERKAEEYSQFCRALEMITSDPKTTRHILVVVSVFLLLHYGLTSLVELGRAFSSDELHHACQEGRLVTTHLGHGVFLPYPLLADMCVGHGLLDDLRFFCWRYAASRKQELKEAGWDQSPSPLTIGIISNIERALAAPLYGEGSGILPRRPETDGHLANPWRIQSQGEHGAGGYALQPLVVRQQLMAYLVYCHREKELTQSTLQGKASMLLHFSAWARRQGVLEHYPHWDQAFAQKVFRTYASDGCVALTKEVRTAYLRELALFFETIAELEYPVPEGHRVLSILGRGHAHQPRPVQNEDVVDRVFREGVCQLSYDPLARAVLAIQYYCGTRITETCDIHLFCILEDQEGHAWLLIPRGKTKQERPFPIVGVGMGILLQYIDEIVSLRLFPDGTSRTLGRTNWRYVNADPERSQNWHYLFERVPASREARKNGHGHGRLSVSRVSSALQEALWIAAKRNPTGLFQVGKGTRQCHTRREKGQRCNYFVAQEGLFVCPCCGSSLSGERGKRCAHRFDKAFQCDGVAREGEMFCPKCDMPLAPFISLTPHMFRHNSVSRAHRAGVSLSNNMRLHGQQAIPTHLRYLHLLLDESVEAVGQVFAQKRMQQVQLSLQMQNEHLSRLKNASPLSLEAYLNITLLRSLKRRTCGIWGGFWAGALAQRGIVSPLAVTEEIVLPEASYEYTVAQYWYETLGLAISEVAFEAATGGEWHAQIPVFLNREKIDALVQFHLPIVLEVFGSPLGRKLIEAEIREQKAFLHRLAELLRPWWQHLGTLDQLVELFAPAGGSPFAAPLQPMLPISVEIDVSEEPITGGEI